MIERREREKERYKERYREGGRDKRVREVKGAQSKPNQLRLMLSPNYGTRSCKKGRGTRTVPSLRELRILGNYEWELSVDYQWEISLRIMRERER